MMILRAILTVPVLALVAVPAANVAVAQPAPSAIVVAQAMTEKQAFAAAKEKNTIAGWEDYLAKYPSGKRRAFARAYLERLKSVATSPDPAAKPQRNTTSETESKRPSAPLSAAAQAYVDKWDDFSAAQGIDRLVTSRLIEPSCSGCIPYIIDCKGQVNSAADLRGRNIRVSNSSLNWVRKIGGTPHMLPGGEIAPALETGIIDCAIVGGAAQ